MKKYLAALFLLTSINLSATHLLGGEITWECKSNGKYQFTLVLFRDCGGVLLPTTAQTLANNAGVSISCSYVNTEDVLTSCYLGTTSCSGSSSGQGKIQKYIYRSGDVQLTGTPPVGGWYFSWNDCCRPGTISNGPANAGYYLKSVMYPYTPPGSTIALTASSCYDNSPQFLDQPSPVSCAGDAVEHIQLSFDRDSDSLHFLFSPVLVNSPNTAASYATGYSATSPTPSGTGSVAAQMDPSTGKISFTSSISGNWAIGQSVEQWRCGQKIGEVRRDFVLTSLACSAPTGLCAANYQATKPNISLTSLQGPGLTPVINTSNDTVKYRINCGLGDSIAFNLTGSDAWIHPNCTSQEVSFEANGPILSLGSNYQLDSTYLGVSAAKIVSLNPGGVWEYTGINSVRFSLKIDSSHLEMPLSCFSNDWIRYPFIFKFQDDECPNPSYSNVVVEFYVDVSTPDLPNGNSCIFQNLSDNTINWSPSQDTGRTWGFYIIESYDTLGIKIATDTLYNWSDSVFVDYINFNQVESYKLSAFNSYGFSNGSAINFNKTPLSPQIISATIDTSNNLLISWNTGSTYNEWFIFSIRDSSLNWHKLDSMQMTGPFSGVLNTSIPSSYIDTTSVTAVKVDARDYCGNISNTVSNNALNLLSLLVTNNDSIWKLTWTPYSDSVETTYSYQVYAKYSASNNFTLIGTTTSHSFNIPADTSVNDLCFYIEVTEIGYSQVITRSNKECLTNIGINNIDIDKVNIFPNPTSGEIIVKIPENLRSDNYVLEAFDNLGKLVYRKPILKGSNILDLGGKIAKGNYVLVIKDDDSKVIKREVIILQ